VLQTPLRRRRGHLQSKGRFCGPCGTAE
jgi:hypothetical protein